MKFWLLINLSLLLVLVTAQTSEAPRGAWFTVIRVETDNAGCRAEIVLRWQEVSK